jgi:benzylsuccinate CoA-transferase BbsF subunit
MTNDRDGAWLPLQGVRVLDFTWMIAGPLGTRLLADFGADVIKVESYNRIDRIRETGPHPEGPWSYNEDGSFNDVNTGKRSILLQLNLPDGQRLAKELAAVSDIVAANFTGDRLDRWGLGFADLVKVRPDLIFLNMPVFESTGPRRRWTGIGTHINGLAGVNGISGFEEDPPFGLGPLYPDFSGNPFHATSAIMAALIERERGAGAQFVEVSQYESTVSILGPALLQQAATGAGPRREGNRSPRACPHNTYPCRSHAGPWREAQGRASQTSSGGPWRDDAILATRSPQGRASQTSDDDRWIAIDCQTDAQWTTLARLIGRPDWAETMATAAQRVEKRREIDAAIAAWTRTREHIALMDELQGLGVPAGAVLSGPELLADPQLAAIAGFIPQDRPDIGVKHYPSQPYRFRFANLPEPRRAPLLGEHTNEVLRERLGLSDEELAELERDDVTGTVPLAARAASAPA